MVLGGRRAAVVVPAVHLALVVALVVRVLGLRVAAPLLGVAHRREAHAARQRAALVVPSVRPAHARVSSGKSVMTNIKYNCIIMTTLFYCSITNVKF